MRLVSNKHAGLYAGHGQESEPAGEHGSPETKELLVWGSRHLADMRSQQNPAQGWPMIQKGMIVPAVEVPWWLRRQCDTYASGYAFSSPIMRTLTAFKRRRPRHK